MLTILVAVYSCTAVVMASGMGPIYSFIEAQYPGEKRTSDLLTYPTLFMGIGNLLSMPLALAIGRRPVFLVTLLLLIVTGVWCMQSQSLSSHIAGRNLMSLAAGQSEALSPLMIQDIHFLHERGRKIGWFVFLQNMAAGGFFVASTYMVSAWGWRWWYGFFAILNAAAFLISIVFVSETDFKRSAVTDDPTTSKTTGNETRTAYGNVIDIERYGERTWKDDLKFISFKPHWRDVATCYKHILQGLFTPQIFWLLLLNGAFLGVYIFQSSTFSTILLSPPFSFAFNSLGYVQAGQILVCIIFLPLLGYGSDFAIRTLSRRNNGKYYPEYRLTVMAIPTIVGLICGIIYGQAAAFPHKWNASAVYVSYNASFFAFLGANIVGITYAVDSFPSRAAPYLVIICTGRGFISFGLSYATLPAVATLGYDMTMVVEICICGALAAIALPMYFCGPRLRVMSQRWYNLEG